MATPSTTTVVSANLRCRAARVSTMALSNPIERVAVVELEARARGAAAQTGCSRSTPS
jgi:hypothetical protein